MVLSLASPLTAFSVVVAASTFLAGMMLRSRDKRFLSISWFRYFAVTLLLSVPSAFLLGIGEIPLIALPCLAVLLAMVTIDAFTFELRLRLQVLALALSGLLIPYLTNDELILKGLACLITLVCVLAVTGAIYTITKRWSLGLGDMIMLPSLAMVTPIHMPDHFLIGVCLGPMLSFLFSKAFPSILASPSRSIFDPAQAVFPAGPGIFVGAQASVLLSYVFL